METTQIERPSVMAEYEKDDAAKDTQSSISEVSKGHHCARDDAAAEGGWRVPHDRHQPGAFVKTSEYLGTSHRPFSNGK